MNDVISLSVRASNDPAVGYIAASICSIVIDREPALESIDAVSAASPSFPAGSCADPTENSRLTTSCGCTDRCSTIGIDGPDAGRVDAGAAGTARDSLAAAAGTSNDASAGERSIPAASGACDSVVTISRVSLKYFRAAC